MAYNQQMVDMANAQQMQPGMIAEEDIQNFNNMPPEQQAAMV